MPADQFKAVAGEEITEMMGWFSDFGCEFELFISPSTTFSRPSPIADLVPIFVLVDLVALSTLLDYGGKEIESSQKVLPEGVKVNTWKTFVEAQDWSKVLA